MDSHCKGPLTCGNDNCRNHFSSSGANWDRTADCCEGILIIVEGIVTFVKEHQNWCGFYPLDTLVTTNAPPTTTALPSHKCDGVPTTDWNCCSALNQCIKGGGDCDLDSQCAGRLICGTNNCRNDFSTSRSSWASSADCCEGMDFIPAKYVHYINVFIDKDISLAAILTIRCNYNNNFHANWTMQWCSLHWLELLFDL